MARRWWPLAFLAQGFWWSFSWGRGSAEGSHPGHTILGQVSLLDSLVWSMPLQMQTLLCGVKPIHIISHILIFSVTFSFSFLEQEEWFGSSENSKFIIPKLLPKCGYLLKVRSIVHFSHSVVSDSLRPHELQRAWPPCPSPIPGVYPNSCQSSWWCHPTILSSVVLFSSCLQSFPTSGSFQMSQFFTSGGQSIIRWPKYYLLDVSIFL